MATRIYGASDDLIEFEGDVHGEVSRYGTDDQPHGVLVVCDDGTMLEVKYGKGGQGIWVVTAIREGSLLDRIEECFDDEADPYSDVAHFHDGLKRAWAATEWEVVR
jgi:hypothetical protein